MGGNVAVFTDNYQSMGSSFSIRVDLPDNGRSADNQIKQLFQQLRTATETLEQCLSRFRTDSELSIANAQVGNKVRISALFADVLKKAERAYRMSGGLFDPRIASVLQNIGYPGVLDPRQTPAQAASAPLNSSSFMIWHEDDVIELMAPIDLGGIGKGYTVDFLANQVSQMFEPSEMSGFFINGGGDIRLYGHQDNGDHWTVGVENPFSPEEPFAAITVTQESVAVCTSSKRRHKWMHDGEEMHHLINPRTGKPVQSDVMSVTAMATEATFAEILTKMIFIESGLPFPVVLPIRYLMIKESKELIYTAAMTKQVAWVTPEATRITIL